jgi:hypothetical protein
MDTCCVFDKIISGNQTRQVAVKTDVSTAVSVLIIREIICLRSPGAYVWWESVVMRLDLCWCIWQESGFSRREDVFTFNLVYKEIL